MSYIVVAVVLISLLYLGWTLTSRSGYESAEYMVIQQDGNFELREYPDLMMATTSMESRTGGDGSFGRLFNYISGSNEEQQKVAMTTPVFMEQQDTAESGQMSFVLPKQVASGEIPQPKNSQVEVTKRPGGRFAAIQFSGTIDDALLESNRQVLLGWIEEQGFTAVGEPEFASYDPPWTPGLLRRNEVLFRIAED